MCREDLLTRLAGALQSAYLPGEEVLGTHEGRTQPCRVIGAELRPDGGAEQVGFAGLCSIFSRPAMQWPVMLCWSRPQQIRDPRRPALGKNDD